MPEPTHEEIQELLGVYALDAVDPETAAMIERHLEGCVRCTTEVAQHHEVAGLLANSGGSSPAGVWDGIASQLDGSTPPSWSRLSSRLETETGPSTDAEAPTGDRLGSATGPDAGASVTPIGTGRSRGRWAVRAVGIVAAAAAVVAIVLGLQVNHLHHQVNVSSATLSGAERSALALATTRKIDLTSAPSTSPQAGKVTVVLTRSGAGFVEAQGLAALPKSRTYQLWGVVGQRTISLGLLGSDPSIVSFSAAGTVPVRAFAITAEHAGGVVQSANQPIVAGEVNA
jgi:Anti-sigma-K factor rskA/Putative zinc-finger